MKKFIKRTSLFTVTLFLLTLAGGLNGTNKILAATTDFTKLQAPITTTVSFSNNLTSTSAKIGQDVTVNIQVNASNLSTTGPTVKVTPRDIVLVIDVSTSMNDTVAGGTKSKLETLKDSAKAFVANFANNDSVRIAFVAYSGSDIKQSQFYNAKSDQVAIGTSIDNIANNNKRDGTNIGDGLRVAKIKLDSEPSTSSYNDTSINVQKSIVLMTDGYSNTSSLYSSPYTHTYSETVKGYYSGKGKNKIWVPDTTIEETEILPSYKYYADSNVVGNIDYVYDGSDPGGFSSYSQLDDYNNHPMYQADGTLVYSSGQTYAENMAAAVYSDPLGQINSYMIGFYTNGESASRLQSIANNAHGTMLVASNASTLNQAFTDATVAMTADYTVSNLTYTLNIPSGLSVKQPLANGMTLSSDGRTITYNLGNVAYKLQSDNSTYSPSGTFPRNLSFTLTSSTVANYPLGATVSYTDLCGQSVTTTANNLSLLISPYDLQTPTLKEYNGNTDVSSDTGRFKANSVVIKASNWGADVQSRWYSIDNGNTWLTFPDAGVTIDKNSSILAQGTRNNVSPDKALPWSSFNIVNIDTAGPTGNIQFTNNRNGTVTAKLINIADAWALDPSKACTNISVNPSSNQEDFTVKPDPNTGKDETITATFIISDDFGNESTISDSFQSDVKQER